MKGWQYESDGKGQVIWEEPGNGVQCANCFCCPFTAAITDLNRNFGTFHRKQQKVANSKTIAKM